MLDTDTKRRLLVVSGGFLVVLVVLSVFVGVVNWQVDLYATGETVDSADEVTVSDLPDECHRFARSLAASQNVSIEEYHVGTGSIDVLLRRTPGGGWTFGESPCSTRLAFQNNLHVGDESYNVEGHQTRSTLHRKPIFRAGQLLGGLAGSGMLLVGYRRTRNSDTE